MASKGTSLIIAGAGVIFLWSGIRGKSWSDVLRHVITGGPLNTLNNANAIQPLNVQIADATTSAASGGGGIGATGNAIADRALQDQGHCYTWGGAPGSNGKGCWDCSSAVNWWLTQTGNPVPGGNWDPGTHGPNTLNYIAWGGARTVASGMPSGVAGKAQAGDIVVDASHMGIAIGNGQMVSALNPSLGTRITSISGTMIPPTFIKRLLCGVLWGLWDGSRFGCWLLWGWGCWHLNAMKQRG